MKRKRMATKAQELKIVRMYKKLTTVRSISCQLELPLDLVTRVVHSKLTWVERKKIDMKIRRRSSHFSTYFYISNSVKNLISKGMSVDEVADVLRIGRDRVERIMECT